jgi:hypothetical protein
MGERLTQSAVCTSSFAAALAGEQRILARWGGQVKKDGLSEQPAGYTVSGGNPECCACSVS